LIAPHGSPRIGSGERGRLVKPTRVAPKGSGSDWELDRLGVREEDRLVDVARASEATPRQPARPVMAILVPGERLAPQPGAFFELYLREATCKLRVAKRR
jgi:hypothetical protein